MNTIQTSEFLDVKTINQRTVLFFVLSSVAFIFFFFFILTINNLNVSEGYVFNSNQQFVFCMQLSGLIEA